MRSRQLSCERRMNISTGAGLITPYNLQYPKQNPEGDKITKKKNIA